MINFKVLCLFTLKNGALWICEKFYYVFYANLSFLLSLLCIEVVSGNGAPATLNKIIHVLIVSFCSCKVGGAILFIIGLIPIFTVSMLAVFGHVFFGPFRFVFAGSILVFLAVFRLAFTHTRNASAMQSVFRVFSFPKRAIIAAFGAQLLRHGLPPFVAVLLPNIRQAKGNPSRLLWSRRSQQARDKGLEYHRIRHTLGFACVTSKYKRVREDLTNATRLFGSLTASHFSNPIDFRSVQKKGVAFVRCLKYTAL